MLLIQDITHLMLHQHFKKAEDFTDSFPLLFSLYIIFQCSGRLPFTTCFLSAKRNEWSAHLIWKSQNTQHIQLKCVTTSVYHFSVFLCFFCSIRKCDVRHRCAKSEFSLPAKASLQYLCLKFHPLHNLFLLFLPSCKFFMQLLPFPESVTNKQCISLPAILS